MYPHRIRLRGPWTGELLYRLMANNQRSVDDMPPNFRMVMPGRWRDGGLSEFQGGVRFTRHFGYPGRIDDFERVWLTFAGLEGRATVRLNDQSLGEIEEGTGPAEFEITSLLRPRNVLCVDIESSTPAGGLWGEVAMEVRATAFLREVRFRRDNDQLTAQGLVIGESPRPLDLYLFARNSFLSHTLVNTASKGVSFVIVGEMPHAPRSAAIHVRVELVDAATIWYVVKGILEPPQTKAEPSTS